MPNNKIDAKLKNNSSLTNETNLKSENQINSDIGPGTSKKELNAVTFLVVGTLLNDALNIITQAQLNPYLIFGFTFWISLSAIISIGVVLVWALKKLKELMVSLESSKCLSHF